LGVDQPRYDLPGRTDIGCVALVNEAASACSSFVDRAPDPEHDEVVRFRFTIKKFRSFIPLPCAQCGVLQTQLFMNLSRNSDSDSSNSQIGLTNQDWNLSRLGCRTNNTPWLQWLCARVWCTVTVEERPLAVNVHVWTCVKCVVWLCVVRRSVYVEVSLDSADRTHTLLRSLILSWREHTSTSHQDNGSPGAHKRKTASQSTQV
jgi:hypothetical protein